MDTDFVPPSSTYSKLSSVPQSPPGLAYSQNSNGISSIVWTMKYLTAGGIAGLISRTMTAPIDRLKVLYQVHSSLALTGDGRPMGLSKGLAAIYKEGGIRGFWRGNLTNVMKVVPESSLFFCVI